MLNFNNGPGSNPPRKYPQRNPLQRAPAGGSGNGYANSGPHAVPRSGQPVPNGYGQPRYNGPPQAKDSNARHLRDGEKLKRDCYSKGSTNAQGKFVPDIAYKSHINILEFSSFPSHPPPTGLPPDQIGSVKDRVLVLCVKQSGRVIIQKGKFSDAKGMYQIGRTWDMDELKVVTRIGNDGFMLLLNKDYFWKTKEGPEVLRSFIHDLTDTYGKFIGKYPQINGWTTQELRLAPVTRQGSVTSPQLSTNVQNPPIDPELMRSRSLKLKHMPKPLLPPEPAPSTENLYKDLDFTANGKLPMKPMKIMQSDRVGSQASFENNSDYRTTDADISSVQSGVSQKRTSHPYQQKSPFTEAKGLLPYQNEEVSINDSQSFVFKSEPEDTRAKIHEYVQANDGLSSPLRNYHPESQQPKRLVSTEPLETSAALGAQLERKLSPDKSVDSHTFEVTVSEPEPEPKREPMPDLNFVPEAVEEKAISPDFGIEEVYDSDASGSKPMQDAIPLSEEQEEEQGLGIHTREEVIEESTVDEDQRAMDASIQDLEAFMDSGLDFAKPKKSPSRKIKVDVPLDSDQPSLTSNTTAALHDVITSPQTTGYALEEDEAIFQPEDTFEEVLQTEKNEFEGLAKDAELEELFDEVGWSFKDDSTSLIRKFSRELNAVKHLNVRELVDLDLRDHSISNDVTTSLGEIQSLSHIFKKMEIDFKFLSPEINAIENNSKGLQVKSINKKLLYNDLKSILDKVSMTSDNLRYIRAFHNFDSPKEVANLEYLLIELHNALGTIGHNAEDDLIKMKALRQYQASYEEVTTKFIKHFNDFFRSELQIVISDLTQKGERVYTGDILAALRYFLQFSGVTLFIRSTSPAEFADLKNFVSLQLDKILETFIGHKLNNVRYGSSNSISSRISQSLETGGLRKSRTLRLSMKREKFKGTIPDASTEDLRPTKPHEIEDPQIVISLINDAGELMSVVQNFLGTLFHYDIDIPDFQTYVENNAFANRQAEIQHLSVDSTDTKRYTNEIITNMNAVFGNFVNAFIRRVTPTEMSVPVLLLEIDTIFKECQKFNQEFMAYSFLTKFVDKLRGIWNKLVKAQGELLGRAEIKSKSGVVLPVRNLSDLIVQTESNLQNHSRGYDYEDLEVRPILDELYQELTREAITMFMRDDPLLKSNSHDERERELRNVAILKNIFYVTELLSFSSPSVEKMKSQLDSVFKKVQDIYFQRLINKSIGKLAEYIVNYELALGTKKKNDRKYLKTLLSNYTHKDIATKADEIYKKIEKQIISGDDMFEQDLLKKLWADMESQFINYFQRLNTIVASVDRDIDYNVTKQEIHQIFTAIYR